MELEINIKLRQGYLAADVEWDVDEVLYQELDNDAEFNRLLNDLSFRFIEIANKDSDHDGH